MHVTIELPKAFSVRDDRELPLVQALMARLNPMLLVIQVATGVHVDGGATVNWGLVYLDGQPLTDEDVQAELEEAGLDFQHHAEIQESRIWVNNQPDMSRKRPTDPSHSVRAWRSLTQVSVESELPAEVGAGDRLAR